MQLLGIILQKMLVYDNVRTITLNSSKIFHIIMDFRILLVFLIAGSAVSMGVVYASDASLTPHGDIVATGEVRTISMKVTAGTFADIQLSDSGAGTDVKTMAIRTDNGRTRFFSIDDVSGILQDNALVMDHLTGNIGFGLGFPSEPLEVAGNIKNSGNIITAGDVILGGQVIATDSVNTNAMKISAATFADIQLSDTGAGTDLKTMAIRSNDGRTIFFSITDIGGILQNNAFVLDHATGNIGLGLGFPGERLEVNGNIKLSGDILAGGDICIGTAAACTP